MTPRPARVFGRLVEHYAAARPGYPPEMFDAIEGRLAVPADSATAVDLATGTGAAAVPLARRGMRVIVVEPDRAMLERAADRLAAWRGRASPVAGWAEALPLRPSSADLVTVAQAFHWLEPALALDEIGRVLRPGGTLAVFWNVVVPDGFVEAAMDLVARYNPAARGRPVTDRMRATPAPLASHPAFVVDPPFEIGHERSMTADRYVDYALSWSYCGGVLDDRAEVAFTSDLRDLIERHHGTDAWEERFVTATHIARRRVADDRR